ncbi:hypothetical protein OYC64_012648 [Pagothenia borchgrevinki]|uniref:Uncharacterized protein n=1 Tax=Pagothenia borchgrevinki TaxID=8213 RepID=A0ABD2G982_PAGBO
MCRTHFLVLRLIPAELKPTKIFFLKMCQCLFKSIAAHHPQSRNLPQTSHKVSPLLTKPQTFLGFDLLHTEYECLLDKSTFRFLLKRKHRDTNQENEETTLLLSDNVSSKCDKNGHVYIHKQALILKVG